MNKLRKLWINLRSSLWFIPVGMVLAAIVLAFVLIPLEQRVDIDLDEKWPLFFGANAEGARGLLGAIATSMITVTGVVFSIVIVALSLASNQYTPRILRNFMRDNTTKTVLGVFVSVFTYSLIVMRSIRGGDEPFVPSIAVAAAILLALIGVGFLIYFIHHIAEGIQATTIIENITDETIAAAKLHFLAEPDPDEDAAKERLKRLTLKDWQTIKAGETGYMQTIAPSLVDYSGKHRFIVRIEKRIGQFVIKNTPLLSVHSAHPLESEELEEMRDFVVINSYRTIEQDPGFGIRQLVDMALKALSPGVNDVSTAISCINALGAILFHIVQRYDPPEVLCLEGNPCVLRKNQSAEHLIDSAFLQIRQSAKENPAIILRLLAAICVLAQASKVPAYRKALHRHVELLEELTTQSVASAQDRKVIHERIAQAKIECG